MARRPLKLRGGHFGLTNCLSLPWCNKLEEGGVLAFIAAPRFERLEGPGCADQ